MIRAKAAGQQILLLRLLEDASTHPLAVVRNSRGAAEEIDASEASL